MLAGLQGGHGDFAVGHVGGQDVHGVDGGVSQQVVIVGVHLGVGGAVLLGGLLGALGNQVAERDQVYKLSLLSHAGKMLLVGDAAAANKADF